MGLASATYIALTCALVVHTLLRSGTRQLRHGQMNFCINQNRR
jgi:hypothetical protein